MKLLVSNPAGPKASLIDIKNNAGRTPLGEAEMAGWDEGAAWLVSAMEINDDGVVAPDSIPEDAATIEDEEGDEAMEISVEVQDAEGNVSKTSIKTEGGKQTTVVSSSTATTS